MLHPRKTNIFAGKVVILGDFNIEAENKVMNSFFEEHTFYNMVKQNTRFKGDGDSCIDLLITNPRFSFMKANSCKTGFSDRHPMIYSILKTKFEKFKTRKSIHHNFKQFKLDIFNSMYVCYENSCSL